MSRPRKKSGSGFKDLIIIFLLIVCAIGGLYIFDKPKFDLYFGRLSKLEIPNLFKTESAPDPDPTSAPTPKVSPALKKTPSTSVAPVIKEDLNSTANDAGMEVGGY